MYIRRSQVVPQLLSAELSATFLSEYWLAGYSSSLELAKVHDLSLPPGLLGRKDSQVGVEHLIRCDAQLALVVLRHGAYKCPRKANVSAAVVSSFVRRAVVLLRACQEVEHGLGVSAKLKVRQRHVRMSSCHR